MPRLAVLLACAVAALPATAAALPPWTDAGLVAPGRQFAAVADSSSVHIIAEAYVQIGADGGQLRSEGEVGDGRQSVLDMYPAIALGSDQRVHVVTRHGGDYMTGHQLRYASRAARGGWTTPLNVGAPVARNYTVGTAVLDSGRVLVSHGRLVDDIGNVVDLYAVENEAIVPLGTTPLGWLRADGDHRLRAAGDRVFLATGTPGPGPMDPVHFSVADDGNGDIVAQWEATHRGLLGGEPRRGGPSLSFDATGRIWMAYGGAGTHHVESFDAAGSPTGGPTQTHDGLGTYHLGYGNGAIEVSPDGMLVVAVALRNADDDPESADAELLYAESQDGGATFGPATPTGFEADGGDGRMRPRLLHVQGTLILLYRDDAVGGIAAATVPWFEPEPTPETTGDATGVDTDETATAGDSTGSEPPGHSDSTADSGGIDEGLGNDTDGGIDPTFPAERGGPTGGCACASSTPPVRSMACLSFLSLLSLLGFRRRRVGEGVISHEHESAGNPPELAVAPKGRGTLRRCAGWNEDGA